MADKLIGFYKGEEVEIIGSADDSTRLYANRLKIRLPDGSVKTVRSRDVHGVGRVERDD